MATTAKKITVLSSDKIRARLAGMIEARENYKNQVNGLHVFISGGNRKTGAIPSVSLIPVADCANCASCAGSCYDLRNDCIYNGVRDSRAKNSAIWRRDPERYFNEISAFCRLSMVTGSTLAGIVSRDSPKQPKIKHHETIKNK